MTGEITTKRTAINVSGKDQSSQVSVQAPAGAHDRRLRQGPGSERRRSGDSDDHLKVKKGKTLDLLGHDQRPASSRTASTSGGSRLTPKHGQRR